MRLLLGAAIALVMASSAPFVALAQPASVNVPGAAEELVIQPREKRAQSPDGDPRSVGEVREHRTAYDQCVVGAPEFDSAHPVESTPEEYCSKLMGMADRNAVPNYMKRGLTEKER